MEEILSSIRRIIADEDAGDSTAGDEEIGSGEARAKALDQDAEALARAADDDQDGDEDVLELTKVVRESGEVVDLQIGRSDAGESMEEAEPTVRAFAQDRDDQELAARDWGDASEDDLQRKDEAVRREQAKTSELMSTTAASVATGAFARLSHALQRTPAEESVADDSGRTVEQFIEDIIRPMLKEWLDEHLPPIIERLVQKEIQKISQRAELS
jgi:uncharacterized protein